MQMATGGRLDVGDRLARQLAAPGMLAGSPFRRLQAAQRLRLRTAWASGGRASERASDCNKGRAGKPVDEGEEEDT